MKQIAVLGLGNFGTALARVWSVAGHQVTGWTVEADVYESISQRQENSKYLPGVSLAGLNVSMDLTASVQEAEYVVLALPSSVVSSVAETVVPLLQPQQVLLDLAKGLGANDGLISEDLEAQLRTHNKSSPLCVMMGPTIAPELAAGVLTTALVASRSQSVADAVAVALTTSTLKLAATDDPEGAEYWGAFKNVIALACGVADGLKATGTGGDNLKAALFTAGYREAVQLLPKLGAAESTALSAAGIGDLFVTAISPHGRNRGTGERLGRGESLVAIQEDSLMVSEGVRAARMFEQRFKRMGLTAPFVQSVCGLLNGSLSADEFVQQVTQ